LIITANRFEGLQQDSDKTDLIMQHASWGILLLLLMFLRLYWRITNLNPVHSYNIADWQKFSAILIHRLIYFVVITQCISGLVSLLFSNFDISFFRLINIHSFIEYELLNEISKHVHFILSIVIYPLLAIHISAALYHQLFGVHDHDS
jgi:cytochrome b561